MAEHWSLVRHFPPKIDSLRLVMSSESPGDLSLRLDTAGPLKEKGNISQSCLKLQVQV